MMISRVFIATRADVITPAQMRRRIPSSTQQPSRISRPPMARVARSAYSSPRIFPTICLWRGMPSRILLKRPWKIQTPAMRMRAASPFAWLPYYGCCPLRREWQARGEGVWTEPRSPEREATWRKMGGSRSGERGFGCFMLSTEGGIWK